MSDRSYLDDMPQPPPIDYSDDDFYLPDEPYSVADVVDELPDQWHSLPDMPPDVGVAPPNDDSPSWRWHEARLIGVLRDGDRPYEVGAVDMYTDTHSGDIGGSYLPISTFADHDQATDFFYELKERVRREADTPADMLRLLEAEANALSPDPVTWQSPTAAEYAAYDRARGLDADVPAPEAVDPLLAEAQRLGGVLQVDPQAQALDAIGLRSDALAGDPPPAFYDEASDTRYWIGVFQADEADRDNCMTAILSLGPDDDGGLAAQLAPCAVGDRDRAYANAEFLIERAQQGGIERVFDAAEAMARGADQRDLWQTSRGMALDEPSAQAIAGAWEADIER